MRAAPPLSQSGGGNRARFPFDYGELIWWLNERGSRLANRAQRSPAGPALYCFLEIASASSSLDVLERPLMPSFWARSYSSFLELP